MPLFGRRVATQNRSLVKGLVVEDKAPGAKNYQQATTHSFIELISAAGLDSHEDLRRGPINKRVGMFNVQTYDEIYPYMQEGCFLDIADSPESYNKYFQLTRIMK